MNTITKKQNRKKFMISWLYGLTIQEYENMRLNQGGKCAICEEFTEVLQVDHSHKTGRVRGLLCASCNNGLGQLKDSIYIIKNSMLYLRQF